MAPLIKFGLCCLLDTKKTWWILYFHLNCLLLWSTFRHPVIWRCKGSHLYIQGFLDFSDQFIFWGQSAHLGGGSSPIKSSFWLHLIVARPEAARQVVRRHPTLKFSPQFKEEICMLTISRLFQTRKNASRGFHSRSYRRQGSRYIAQNLWLKKSNVFLRKYWPVKFLRDLRGKLRGGKPEHPETCCSAQHNGGVWSWYVWNLRA